ncbi:putative serine/threonine protein kinase [Streptomyces sparsogenes DSM 40356]|uniref:Putative serine/threonine protein kinase n=1 Tax=Streptomyces sparsogenes DSM 40356 TaxID=1331668 RepID=A0A1R1SJE0_9ACTN|nr:putative serine/threonine protein kinase [Streptomyces sparsogenes DSM 40356]
MAVPLSAGDPETMGDYRLLGRLGSGGMGVVYLARSASGRQVAVKVVHAQFAEDEEFRTRFRQEVAAARRVSGAFTAPVLDADPDAERPWMATLYVPGPTLSERLTERGPLNAAELRRLALGLAEALHDIHRVGVVHRDLKPANVLMADDGPRVIDFGISRAADNQALTVTGRVMGTPPFMSPEQLSRPREVTGASDVFSLGTLLVYATTGKGPFDGESPYLTAYQVVHEPPELSEVAQPLRGIVERCLAKAPDDRPGIAELVRLLDGLPAKGEVRTVGRGSAGRRGSAGGSGGEAADGPGKGSGKSKSKEQGPGQEGDRDGAGAAGMGQGNWTAWSGVRRRRPVLAAVIAVAALALGGGAFALYAPDDDGGGGVRTSGRPADAARMLALPSGWRPWQVSLPKAAGPASPSGEYDDYVDFGGDVTPLCVRQDTKLYCGGSGFPTVRVDALTGHVDWSTRALVDSETSATGSAPAGVRGGLVFVHDSPSDTVSRLVVLDADSGHKKWARPTSTTIDTALFDDMVLSSSADDRSLVARDADTGEQRWSYRVPKGQLCTATVYGNVPYGVCWDDTQGDTEDDTLWSTLVRLDKRDGSPTKLARLKDTEDGLGLDGDDLLILPATDGADTGPHPSVLRLDIRTGDKRRVTLPKSAVGTATLTGGRLFFIQESGKVTAVDVDSGRQLWSRQTTVERLGKPVVSAAENTVYLCSASGRLLALDLRTGAELWQSAPRSEHSGSGGGPESSQVLRLGGAIVALASDGTLFSADPRHPDAEPSKPANSAEPPPDSAEPTEPAGGSASAKLSAKPSRTASVGPPVEPAAPGRG